MTSPRTSKTYRDLVEQTRPQKPPPPLPPEQELDTLITALKERQKQAANEHDAGAPDPIQTLREVMANELVPTFLELVEKYSKSGMSMQMDASNFLEGGREIRFEFGIGDYRTQLHGTVTTEAIAFHETRYAPDVHGELLSGPMLRLRGLDARVFRAFICERLTILLRGAVRRR